MGEHSAKHDKLFKLAELNLEEITTLAKVDHGDDIETCVEKVCTLIKRLENSIEKTKETMIDNDVVLEEIIKWSSTQTKSFSGNETSWKSGNLKNSRKIYVNMSNAIHYTKRIQNTTAEIEWITEKREHCWVMVVKGATPNVFTVAMRITSPLIAQRLRVADRREILKNSKLCYNCTGKGHTATKCRSRNCTKCGQRHHTSLCEQQPPTAMDLNAEQKPYSQKQGTESILGGSGNATKTLHPTVMAKVGGRDVRIMIDTGASSSYVCSNITALSLKPKRRERRCVEQMYGTVTKHVDIYDVHIREFEKRNVSTTATSKSARLDWIELNFTS